jgi:nucleosome assembly protein 1-like 1
MDPEIQPQDHNRSDASSQPAASEAILAQVVEEAKAEIATAPSEVQIEEPKADEVDSEIEDLQEQERNAEAKVQEQSEPVRQQYQKLLDNQRARNSIYVAYMAELRAINLKYETHYFEHFNRRAELSTQVEDFWLTVLRNNPITGETIVEKDYQLLRFLKNISYTEAKHGRYTELIFEFNENPFIAETRLVKPFEIDSDEEIQSKEGTTITWKGQDFTMEELKTKKKRKGKPVRIITKLVPCESFFNLFKSSADLEGSDSEDQEDFEEDDIEICLEIKDEIIPYAFLWYAKARHHDDSDDEDDEEDDVKDSIRAMAADASGPKEGECKTQ